MCTKDLKKNSIIPLKSNLFHKRIDFLNNLIFSLKYFKPLKKKVENGPILTTLSSFLQYDFRMAKEKTCS